jgi:hypothetical protein
MKTSIDSEEQAEVLSEKDIDETLLLRFLFQPQQKSMQVKPHQIMLAGNIG